MEKPIILPVAPLRDSPIFPLTEVPLVFSRSKSVSALKSAADTNRLIFITGQKNLADMEPTETNLYEVGTICQIKHIFQTDNEVNVLVSGISRAKVIRYQTLNDLLVAELEEIPDKPVNAADSELVALSGHIAADFQRAIRLGRGFDFFVLVRVTSGLGPAELANQMGQVLEFSLEEKQALLEETDIKIRLQKVTEQLAKEINMIELEKKIVSSSQEKFDKSAKQTILMERKKAIEQELGEMDEEASELKELEKKAKSSGMPEEVLKKTLKEIKRLERMNSMNPEAGGIRTYVDWLLDMPWSVVSPNNASISQAEKILDEDHYGLEKIKERIVEYLAVLKLKHKMKGEIDKKKKAATPTILCFVGPPGVGKTSIGKSIARALNRKFVRISLGGIRDEAEIRGHRRTYIGALPGRIVQGIKQAGTRNPVFMLDEIDKIGTDFRGDPSAALLEALDPEQNADFSDHYLEVPFDLSDVIFITTANVLDTVPPALLDRLEIINFPGYTANEKLVIAEKYLVRKQLEGNGLKQDQGEITREALKLIISRYTREAGVRSLEREIAHVFRKIAKKIASGKAKGKTIVTDKVLDKYLGPRKFTSTIAERKDEVGLVTGLAWTQVGGTILFIEVATMPGKGTLTITGQLGDVMQESAKAALSYVRSRWKVLGLKENFFQKMDIHIHVPEGATPKDGPSAGSAITTALASALTKVPVKRFVAMTGEVTLRGRVLPIGGVKEKVIAAHVAGIKTVILPKENKKDLEDIPKYILKDLQFKFVGNMDEVLGIALSHRPKNSKG